MNVATLRGFSIFLVAATFHIVSLVMEWRDLATVTKFALMPTLIVGVVLVGRRWLARPDFLLIAALVLAWVGDIFVGDAAGASFIVGLGAFLAAHVVYFFLFVRALKSRRVPRLALVLVFWWGGLLAVLHDDLGVFFVPLAVYGATLGASTAAALATNPLIAAGAVLFLASDTALAWSLFSPMAVWWQSDAVIMALYAAGQLLIAWGVVSRRRSVRKGSERRSVER